MRDKIINKASSLFLNLGFKSVTMDDIAAGMGVSKKTIYQNFSNKADLVKACTLHVFQFISEGIDAICALEHCPIEELFEVKKFVMKHLKDEKSSPQYQLQKYYPEIYNTLKYKQFVVMQSCIKSNIHKGMKLKLYRDNLDVEFISRIYFSGMLALKDKELFLEHQFNMTNLMQNYIEYHLRGISTPKGIEKLNALVL